MAPRHFVSRLFGTGLLLWALSFSHMAAYGQPPELTDEALVHALRSGGYNIYFRHAQTDWSQQDHIDRTGDWISCDPSRVRQLADIGRETSRSVGAAIRALRIPIGQVLASPYCRTVETAKLFALGPVMTTTDIINLRVAAYFDGRDAVVATARRRLGDPPPTGTNTIFVAHGNLARAATDVYPAEAEGLVFRPAQNGGFTFVGRLTPADWARLAAKPD